MNKSLIKKFSLKNKKLLYLELWINRKQKLFKFFIEAGAKVMVFDENIKYGKKLEKKYSNKILNLSTLIFLIYEEY